MTDSNTSFQNYALGGDQRDGGERLPLGAAMLVIGVLSLLAWAAVVLPVIAFLHI
jgi:hypothetical protein